MKGKDHALACLAFVEAYRFCSLSCQTHLSQCFPFQIHIGVLGHHQHSKHIEKSSGSLTHCLCGLSINILMFINVINTFRCMLHILHARSIISMR